jgi:hypothetical protein
VEAAAALTDSEASHGHCQGHGHGPAGVRLGFPLGASGRPGPAGLGPRAGPGGGWPRPPAAGQRRPCRCDSDRDRHGPAVTLAAGGPSRSKSPGKTATNSESAAAAEPRAASSLMMMALLGLVCCLAWRCCALQVVFRPQAASHCATQAGSGERT